MRIGNVAGFRPALAAVGPNCPELFVIDRFSSSTGLCSLDLKSQQICACLDTVSV